MNHLDTIRPGSLLIPNEYMVRNGDTRTIIILEVIQRDGLAPDLKVLFSDGFVNQVRLETIVNLYELPP